MKFQFKPVLVAVVATALFAALAGATPAAVSGCLPAALLADGTGSATLICPGVGSTPTGSVLDSVTLLYTAGYQLASPAASVVMSFAPSTFAGVSWTQAVLDLEVTNPAIQLFGSVKAMSGLLIENFVAPFTVDVSSIVKTGTVGAALGGVSVSYAFHVPAPVPEPGTMLLIAGGLLSFSSLLRRRL